MAKNPDPLLPITSYQGKTRTLDDWATVFNLAIVVLPDRPEGAAFLPVIERLFATFGDSDVRTIVCVPSAPAIAKRIMGDDVDKWLVWCDPERAFVTSLGLERLPAFVHLRLDTSLVGEDACGSLAIDGLTWLAREKSLRVQQLELLNSGDTAGSRDRVVGYGAFAFYEVG